MHRKIVFRLEQDADGYPPVAYEGIWAIYQEGNRYVIDNTPFFTREATLGDIVEAARRDDELVYVRTLAQSDNSLIRVVYYETTDPTMLRKDLEQIGCSTEWDSDHQLIAINVPPEVKLNDIQEFLQNGFDQDRWDYEEAIMRQ
jgi:Domain of unknown function (DUF4265)